MLNNLVPFSAIVTLIAVSASVLKGASYHYYLRLLVFLTIAVVGFLHSLQATIIYLVLLLFQ